MKSLAQLRLEYSAARVDLAAHLRWSRQTNTPVSIVRTIRKRWCMRLHRARLALIEAERATNIREAA